MCQSVHDRTEKNTQLGLIQKDQTYLTLPQQRHGCLVEALDCQINPLSYSYTAGNQEPSRGGWEVTADVITYENSSDSTVQESFQWTEARGKETH